MSGLLCTFRCEGARPCRGSFNCADEQVGPTLLESWLIRVLSILVLKNLLQTGSKLTSSSGTKMRYEVRVVQPI